MTAKEYLNRIRRLNTRIDNLIVERQQVWDLALSTGAVRYDRDRVQSSPSGTPRQLSLIEKAADMDRTITSMIDRLVDMKHDIIEQIHQLSDDRFIQILFKKYVELKPLTQIADELNYDYKWTCRLHGYALSEFGKLLKEHDQTRLHL